MARCACKIAESLCFWGLRGGDSLVDNVDNVDDVDDFDDEVDDVDDVDEVMGNRIKGNRQSDEGSHKKSRVTTTLRLQDCRSLAPLGHVTTPS